MDDVTQQNAAQIRTSRRPGLEEQATNLKTAVSVFRVSEQRETSSYINAPDKGSASPALG